MFAPQGYTSLAKLWVEFIRHRRKEIYVYACETYQSPTFRGDAHYGVVNEFGSPKDLLEEIFIDTVKFRGVTLCSTDGTAASVLSSVADGSSDLLQRSLVFESTVEDEEHAGEEERADWLCRMGSNEFESWPHKLANASLWAEAYPVPDGTERFTDLWDACKYHRLPMWFERHRFSVPSSLPPWNSDAIDAALAKSTIPNILGMSMCLKDHAARRWRSENIRGDAYRASMGQITSELPRVGRPSKQKMALHYFDELFPDGQHPSWKSTCSALYGEFGIRVSEKTLRRALSDRAEKIGQKAGQN